MDTQKIIQSQYLAALEMLKQAVVKCPDPLWNAAEDGNKFWHVAYHALFYTHLYLQDTEKDFKPWEKASRRIPVPGTACPGRRTTCRE